MKTQSERDKWNTETCLWIAGEYAKGIISEARAKRTLGHCGFSPHYLDYWVEKYNKLHVEDCPVEEEQS